MAAIPQNMATEAIDRLNAKIQEANINVMHAVLW